MSPSIIINIFFRVQDIRSGEIFVPSVWIYSWDLIINLNQAEGHW